MATRKQNKNWQGERSLVECNRYMMEHDIADVTFELKYKNKHRRVSTVQVKALKTLLLARSSVFHAMFCGELKEQSQVITVTDVEPGAFKELIRYMYTDDVHLTGDNVLAVLYASKKYMVSTLTTKCAEYLENQLNADTALDLLEQSIFFEEKELMSKCIVKIQSEASRVLSSDGFANISKAAVHEILKSEDMNAPEIEVFKACVSWAQSQCSKNDQIVNASNMRAILGDDLFLLRIPAMSVKEFNDHVVPHELLTYQEGFQLFRHFTSEGFSDNLPFSAEPRGNPFSSQLLMVQEPFVPIHWAFGIQKSISLQCTLTRDIKLSKILMQCVTSSPGLTYQASITITQVGKQIGSVSNNQLNTVHAAGKCPEHVALDVNNVVLHKGNLEITCIIIVHQPHARQYDFKMRAKEAEACTVMRYRSVKSPPALTILKDNNITIDCHPAQENMILGIEYSLVM